MKRSETEMGLVFSLSIIISLAFSACRHLPHDYLS